MSRGVISRVWTRLFSAPAGERTAWEIIVWWETRRIAYNLIMAVVGICGLLAFFALISASGELQPGEDAVEPFVVFAAPLVANICYTAGWVMELVAHATGVRSNRIGPALFGAGLAFSCAVAWLPALLWGGICLWHLASP
jgi:hypothetical protein